MADEEHDDVSPFPFATVDDLRKRWPDMPADADEQATALLEDASDMILDEVPEAVEASERTRRRVACAVVQRAMAADPATVGLDQFSETTGAFSFSGRMQPDNGDLFLKRREKRALGGGRSSMFSVQLVGGPYAPRHRPWCDVYFSGRPDRCSCGAALTGDFPLYEG